MKTLVLGGNRFFGKILVDMLLQAGHQVTMLNRGNSIDEYGAKISRIVVDRQNEQALREDLADSQFDVVFDQICFDAGEAQAATRVFKGKVGKYIFTSSMSVYNDIAGPDKRESEINPGQIEIDSSIKTTDDYGTAKKMAEAVFARYAPFPVTMVRFPIVVGNEDHTNRFQFHVERVRHGKPIFFRNIDARFSFISARDAAKTLLHLARNSHTGPINAASPTPIVLSKFMHLIEQACQRKMIETDNSARENRSPYGVKADYWLNTELLKETGLQLEEVTSWLPEMLKNYPL